MCTLCRTKTPAFRGLCYWVVKTILGDTIAAIATATGIAGIGVVRISGPDAILIADELFRSSRGRRLVDAESHRLYHGTVEDANGYVLDDCLAVAMRGPASFTGEDVVEFHCHGSPVILRAVLSALITAGARMAGPGEFTRRAFVNGKLDLVQVEAVSDLLYARSERAGILAARQLGGALSQRIGAMREALLAFLAHVHAAIDYPDEVPDVDAQTWQLRVEELLRGTEELLAEARLGMQVRDGIDAVLIGRANVGKSSLLNALLRTPRAIVTEVPGTTRDVIEEAVQIAGVAFRLSDTAGIEETTDPVEQEGIVRSLDRADEADLLLGVFDSSQPFQKEDERVLRLLAGRANLIVLNKCDLEHKLETNPFLGQRCVTVSARTGEGLTALEEAMAEVAEITPAVSENLLLTRPRQVGALQATARALKRVLTGLSRQITADCLAVELETALWHLGELTGETTPEDVVSEIFRRFCVGK